MKIIYRPRFWIDLEEGVAYLAKNASPEIAQSWHGEILAAVNRLEKQPDLGRHRCICHIDAGLIKSNPMPLVLLLLP